MHKASRAECKQPAGDIKTGGVEEGGGLGSSEGAGTRELGEYARVACGPVLIPPWFRAVPSYHGPCTNVYRSQAVRRPMETTADEHGTPTLREHRRGHRARSVVHQPQSDTSQMQRS